MNPCLQPSSPTLQADSLPAEPQGTPKNTGLGSLSLFQGIFPTQEANWGLLHCRRILYQLSYQGCKWPFFLYPLWSLLHTGGYRERGSKLSGFSSFKTFLKLIYFTFGCTCLHCFVWAFSSCGERGYSSLRTSGFSLLWLLLLRITALGTQSTVATHRLYSSGSGVVVYRLSCSTARGIFLDQGLNPALAGGFLSAASAGKPPGFFYDKGIIMTSSKPDYSPGIPSPNTIPLGVGASTCEIWGDTIQSTAGVNTRKTLSSQHQKNDQIQKC